MSSADLRRYSSGAFLLLLMACGEQPTDPPTRADSIHPSLRSAQSAPRLIDVPAVTMDVPTVARSWDIDDAELISVLEREEGHAVIAFKLPTSPRVMETGGRRNAVPASAFSAGLELVLQSGAEILLVYQSFGAAWVRIPPELGPQLRQNALVDYLEPRQWRDVMGVRAEEAATALMLRSLMQQTTPWGISLVRAPEAWTLTTGAGVKVMVIDQGVSPHVDLPTIPAGNCGGAYGGCDGPKHGTHVAGTLIAQSNSIGVVGGAPGIDGSLVYGWGACSELGCSTTEIAAGIDAARFAGVRVINMSLGGPNPDLAESNAVAQAWQTGSMVLVAAAGNLRSVDNPRLIYPAAYSNVIGVSGVRTDKSFAGSSPCTDGAGGTWRSNWGTHVDLSAPFWALSTVGASSYENEASGWCGTSMATPHVSAAAALVWARYPTYNNGMVANQLFTLAQDLGSWGKDDLYGFGLVDAAKAVGYQPPPPPFTVSIVGNTEIEAFVSCSWSANVSGGAAPYTFEWTVNGQPAGDGSETLWYSNDGNTFTIRVTVTDGEGRQASDEHDVAIVSGRYCA